MKQRIGKIFVLDTNILMHDPTAFFNFQENDIYLPMVVLEELDNHKTGVSEVARNVRQANRILMELIAEASHAQIVAGIPVNNLSANSGRLFFQTEEFDSVQF